MKKTGHSLFVFFLLLVSACTPRATFTQAELDLLKITKTKLDTNFSEIESETKSLTAITTDVFKNKNQYLKSKNPPQFSFAKTGVYHKATVANEPDAWLAAKYAKDPRAREVAIFTQGIDQELQRIVKKNKNVVQVYFNSKNSFNRIFPPINAVSQYEPLINITEFNFYYLADLKNNPTKKVVWVDEPYIDPAGSGWMVSAISPIYVNSELEGVVGLDITLAHLEEELAQNTDLHFLLLHKNGLVISTTDRLAQLLELPDLKNHQYIETIKSNSYKPEQFNLLKSKSEAIRDLTKKILSTENFQTQNVLNRNILLASVALKNLPWVLVAFKETP
jgi:hypothetical protein